MDSHHKARQDTPHSAVEVTPKTVYERLHQFRTDRQKKIDQAPAKQKRVATIYGDVPSDLDRIAQAKSSIEVLDVLNQVLQVLHRSGRMAEVPEPFRMDYPTNSYELRVALGRMNGGHEEEQLKSDGAFVLRAALSAADQRLRQLRWRGKMGYLSIDDANDVLPHEALRDGVVQPLLMESRSEHSTSDDCPERQNRLLGQIHVIRALRGVGQEAVACKQLQLGGYRLRPSRP
jgi:hypothetical protein